MLRTIGISFLCIAIISFTAAEILKHQKAVETQSNSAYPRNMNYIAVPDSGSASTENISTIEDIDIQILALYADKFPFITALCRIVDEHNRMVSGLDEGDFDVWEMHVGPPIEQYPLIVNQIGGSNMVDFVFCIDTTGSMGIILDNISIGISWMLDSLASSALSCRFFTDFEPPRIGGMYPSLGEIIENNRPDICFDIWDDETGVDAAGVLFAVYSTSFGDTIPPPGLFLDTDTPDVSISGENFCWNPSIGGYEFLDGDTVCVTILRAEDTPDYGEPNSLSDSLFYWCFFIGE